MKIYVDLDGTLCTLEEDYADAQPYPDAIAKINTYFKDGHKIVIWTARGTGTGKDWRRITEGQLRDWGVWYHRLLFEKPIWDIYICDKSVNAEGWRKLP